MIIMEIQKLVFIFLSLSFLFRPDLCRPLDCATKDTKTLTSGGEQARLPPGSKHVKARVYLEVP